MGKNQGCNESLHKVCEFLTYVNGLAYSDKKEFMQRPVGIKSVNLRHIALLWCKGAHLPMAFLVRSWEFGVRN